MPELELFSIFTSRLNKANINYFVTGAVASIIYGEPRLTDDIDLVVELGRSDAVKFMEAFPDDPTDPIDPMTQWTQQTQPVKS